ncbi:hypothetical protein EV368DRAFT_81394 [Lentinula lateritia]|nr:hypothetical protein EV368DRAFT_81394 [Lentinula lateritia]
MAPPPNRHAEVDEDDDEDEIMRKALAKVQRVKEKKAEEATRRRAEEEEEVTEWRRLIAEAATVRSQRETSPRRPVVEIWRAAKGKGKAKAQLVGGDPNDGDDSDDDDDDEEDQAPCERGKTKKLPCQMQAGKRSSIICKPCHDSKVKCWYSGCPTTSKQREGGSGERIAIMESQMVQSLADLWVLREANSKMHQYLHQLLQKQEDDHACLIAMETRMAMMGMGEGSATAGPSRQTTKRRRVVEESDEEEDEEEKGKEVEKEMEEDGGGEVEEEGGGMEVEEGGEREAPAKTVASEKGEEKEVVE